MRPWLPVCALLALGCSEAPAALDAGTDGPSALDGGGDAGTLPDVAPSRDVTDAAVRGDAADATSGDVVDAPELPDVALVFDVPRPQGDVVDAGQGDATPAPDAVDAGAGDAGPQVYALDPPPGALEVRALFGVVCPGGTEVCGIRERVTGATCARVGNRVSFSFRACNASGTCEDVSGAVPDYRSAAGATAAIVGGDAAQGRDFDVAAGPAGARQSFRVSFSAAPTSSAAGVTGLPGRTVSPVRGDVWLLGCEVR